MRNIPTAPDLNTAPAPGVARPDTALGSTVLIVSAPGFAHGWSPLGVARLAAYVAQYGHEVETLPLCVSFTDYITRRRGHLVEIDEDVGEFGTAFHELYFSSLLFGHDSSERLLKTAVRDMLWNRDIYCHGALFPSDRGHPVGKDVENELEPVVEYCEAMHRFLIRRLDRVDLDRFDVIGFSCMEAQFLTSVFLAREIARRASRRPTFVFGGPMFQMYNADILAKRFPEIDHVVVGEGELPFRRFLDERSNNDTWQPVSTQLAAPFTDKRINLHSQYIEAFPPPDYSGIPKAKVSKYTLTTYVGKGCSHWRCSFCPISERGQYVREARTIFAEIKHLISIYGRRQFHFGDWEINGDPHILEELCDLLIADRIKLDAWAEINARNTSLRLFRKMARAGISNVQIGLESFSGQVLRTIRKPAIVLDNVKALKWGIEAGMDHLFSNILCNHPLTRRPDVRENFRVLRRISHLLRPPVELEVNDMELYRTSDMFERAEHFGIRNIRDYDFYRRLYPTKAIGESIPMFNLAYRRDRVDPIWRQVRSFVRRCANRPSRLTICQRNGRAYIYDSRGRTPRRFTIGGLDAEVLFRAADRIAESKQTVRDLAVPEEKLRSAVARLEQKRLLMRGGGGSRFLALPLQV